MDSREGRSEGSEHDGGAVISSPDRVLRTCPVCGSRLGEQKCKLVCPDPVCTYFLSCADYY